MKKCGMSGKIKGDPKMKGSVGPNTKYEKMSAPTKKQVLEDYEEEGKKKDTVKKKGKK